MAAAFANFSTVPPEGSKCSAEGINVADLERISLVYQAPSKEQERRKLAQPLVYAQKLVSPSAHVLTKSASAIDRYVFLFRGAPTSHLTYPTRPDDRRDI